jgi:hypothetical protein
VPEGRASPGAAEGRHSTQGCGHPPARRKVTKSIYRLLTPYLDLHTLNLESSVGSMQPRNWNALSKSKLFLKTIGFVPTDQTLNINPFSSPREEGYTVAMSRFRWRPPIRQTHRSPPLILSTYSPIAGPSRGTRPWFRRRRRSSRAILDGPCQSPSAQASGEHFASSVRNPGDVRLLDCCSHPGRDWRGCWIRF